MNTSPVEQLIEIRTLLTLAEDSAVLLRQIEFMPAVQRRALANMRRLVAMAKAKAAAVQAELIHHPVSLNVALVDTRNQDLMVTLRDYEVGPLLTRGHALENLAVAGIDAELAGYLLDLVDARLAQMGRERQEE